jgi:hypothetical protein
MACYTQTSRSPCCLHGAENTDNPWTKIDLIGRRNPGGLQVAVGGKVWPSTLEARHVPSTAETIDCTNEMANQEANGSLSMIYPFSTVIDQSICSDQRAQLLFAQKRVQYYMTTTVDSRATYWLHAEQLQQPTIVCGSCCCL